MSQEQAKQKIGELIKKYEEVLKSGEVKKYTEEETKKDFILPLFQALGWDVFNKKEVSAEEHIKSSGRVDYGFYINSRTKFYLEAKPLKADLNDEDFAKQAIRYSWNRGVTWAVLTNFESVKVFNAQAISKYLGDKLYFEIPYSEFLERFDQLWQLSRDEFEHDLIDKEAERVGKKLQKVSITSLLYKDLNESREILTKGFTLWNKHLDKDLLDEGVQRLLDRLIFIRVAEDRGIEPPTLQPLLREWKTGPRKEPFFKSLISKFRELDAAYNSNLFSPHPFEDWEEYDNVTEEAIAIFYGKPGYYEYDFKAIPADVLGTVYENYLGYRLAQSKKELTIAKDAKKRKEQGIYYTPNFIVDYIVRNALGPVLDKCRSFEDLKKIKVLDPACGSGSFLIKALEVIGDKYKEFNRPVDTNTKIQIIIENLYGVDLDEQAVEIARLNLMIAALDNRVLFPSLSNNIKNGNSLISGTDEELKKYFGKDFQEKKPFNWEEEFSDVFKQGGFDCIIGNPPYIRVDALDEEDKIFWKNYFVTPEGKYDLYYLFIEKSIKLLKDMGQLGFIVPNKFCVADSGQKLRKLILESSKAREFLSVSKINVFKEASNYPVILLLQKGESGNGTILSFAEREEEILGNHLQKYVVEKQNFDLLPNDIIPVNTEEAGLNLVIKLLKSRRKSKDYLKISEGLRMPEKFESQTKEAFEIVKQYQFSRYSDIKQGNYISEKNLKTVINKGAERFKNTQKEKVLIAEDALFISATIDVNQRIPQGGVYFATPILRGESLYALLGILNSKLLSFVYKIMFSGMHMGGGYLRYRTTFLNELPIEMNGQENNINKLVKQILKLNIELSRSNENSNEWIKLKDEIAKTDQKIDEEVYKLYGLTPEEIKIVEGNK